MSIYKITNSENDFIYIGKTVKSLQSRLFEHELDYGGWLNRGCRRSYISSFELLRFRDYKIELLETVYDDSLLNEREIHYINTIECVNITYNKNIINPIFLCPCGETINSTLRRKHTKSPSHRKTIRDLHSKTNTRTYFINLYKSSKTENIPIKGGITLHIDCEPKLRKTKEDSGLVLNIC